MLDDDFDFEDEEPTDRSYHQKIMEMQFENADEVHKIPAMYEIPYVDDEEPPSSKNSLIKGNVLSCKNNSETKAKTLDSEIVSHHDSQATLKAVLEGHKYPEL